jgi:predicted small secreted protein
MKYKILSIFAFFGLAACNTVDGASEDLSSAWDTITMTSNEQAFDNYTKIVYKHSKESIANYSYRAVQLCSMQDPGLTYDEFVHMLHDDKDMANKCWNALVDYPNHDKRFYNEDSPEQLALQEFDLEKPEMTKMVKKHLTVADSDSFKEYHDR